MDVLVHRQASELHVLAVRLGTERSPAPTADPLELSLGVDDALQLLRVDRAALEREVPIFDASRGSELEVRPGIERCVGGRREGERVSLGLRAEVAEFFELVSEAFVPMESVPEYSLELPVDDTLCGEGPPRRFHAFGPEPHVLAGGTPIGGGVTNDGDPSWRVLRRAEAIDADRLLVASDRAVFMLERGRAWTGEASRLWVPEDGNRIVRRIVRMPAESSEGRLSFLVLLWALERDGRNPRLIRLEWSEAGFGPEEVVLDPVPDARHLDLDRRGRVVISGDAGTIYYGGVSSSDPITRVQVPALFADVRAFVAGHPPAPPHIFVASQARLHLGDLDAPDAFQAEESSETYRSPREVASRPGSSGGTEVFHDADNTDVYLRRVTGERTLLRHDLPHAAVACAEATDACGRRSPAGRTGGLLPEAPDSLLVGLSNCSVVLELDLSLGCTRALPLEGVEILPRPEGFSVAVQAVEGRVFLLGADGLLMEAR